LYHHIYAWGNDRHLIFRDEEHHDKYLALLERFSQHYGVEVIAYALMEWHVHLFVHDHNERISKFMNSLHGDYAQYFNKTTRRVGHVFGERFNNKVVQVNTYGLWLSRYIHRQAIEARLVKDPKNYPWTSYRAYIGIQPVGFLQPAVIWEQFGTYNGPQALRTVYKRYQEFVLGVDESPVDWDKYAVPVIGDSDFINRVSKHTDREIHDSGMLLGISNLRDLLKTVSAKIGVEPKSLLRPVNNQERQLRQQAYQILTDKYGLSLRVIGRMFNVSAPAVLKALRKENR